MLRTHGICYSEYINFTASKLPGRLDYSSYTFTYDTSFCFFGDTERAPTALEEFDRKKLIFVCSLPIPGKKLMIRFRLRTKFH